MVWVIALAGSLVGGPQVRGQSYASVAGTYNGTEDSVQTLTYGGESETLTDSYEISNLVIRQNGAVFTYSAQPPGGGSSSYTRTGTLNGNRIVALTGPVVIEVSPEIRVTRNEITSVEGTVSDGKIVIRMTGIAEGIYQGVKGRFDVRSTSVLFGPAAAVPDISINAQPQDRTVIQGEAAAFTVAAKGNSALSYQWRKDGVNLSNGGGIAGANSATLTIAGVQPEDAGEYSVRISNAAGAVTSRSAALTVLVPPRITRQPQGASGAVGTAAQFTVDAAGTMPLSFRWRKDGADLSNGARFSGVADPTLFIKALELSDVGAYTVVVSNQAGSITSSNARLAVLIPPTITQQPQPVAASLGAPAQFTVVASGTRPLAYQWRKDGIELPGESSATLRLSAVEISDAGTYDVIVSNAGGAATSEGALLTVSVPQPATPLKLAIAWMDGAPELTATGEPGWLCALERTTSLSTPAAWIPLTNLLLQAGSASVKDNTHEAAQSFYRLRRAEAAK